MPRLPLRLCRYANGAAAARTASLLAIANALAARPAASLASKWSARSAASIVMPDIVLPSASCFPSEDQALLSQNSYGLFVVIVVVVVGSSSSSGQ